MAYHMRTGKLVFPIFKNWTKLTLFTAEIFEGAKRGIYKYKLASALDL